MRTVTNVTDVRLFVRVAPASIALRSIDQYIPANTRIEIAERAESLYYDHRPGNSAIQVKWDGIIPGQGDYGEYFVLESELRYVATI